jgi:hypothetical protein
MRKLNLMSHRSRPLLVPTRQRSKYSVETASTVSVQSQYRASTVAQCQSRTVPVQCQCCRCGVCGWNTDDGDVLVVVMKMVMMIGGRGIGGSGECCSL